MILKAIIYGIFLTGIVAIEVTRSEVYTSKSISDDSIVVESNGSLALSYPVRLSISSLTVKPSAQFLTNTVSEGIISIGSFNNEGYTLFDVSQVQEPLVWFGSNNYNSGELVIHGRSKLNVHMDPLVNWGSMTIWGDDGVSYINGSANYGNMCFHGSIGIMPYASGNGCIALAESTVFANYIRPDFSPTIAFGSGDNGFLVQRGPHIKSLYLNNFGGSGNYVGIADDGYRYYEYDGTALFVYIGDYYVYIGVGSGYDKNGFIVTQEYGMVYIRYPHQVPSRANKGRCSCVLNTRPVPEVTTTFGATTLASIQVTTTSDSVETSLEAFGSFVATPFPKTTSSIEGVPTAEATGIEEAPVTEVTPIVEQSSPSEEVSEVEEPVVVERV